MSFLDFKRIVSKLPKVSYFSFSGGEPVLHPDLKKMIMYVSRRMVDPIVFTSGFPFMNDFWKDLPLTSVQVTLRFPNAFLEDKFRGVKSFDSAIKTLEVLKKLGVYTQIHMPVWKENVKYIEDMARLAKKYNSDVMILPFLSYSGSMKDSMLSEKELEHVKNKCKKLGLIYGLTEEFCLAGISRIAVDVNGTVRPCVYLTNEDSVGSLLEEEWKVLEKRLERWRLKQGKLKGLCLARLRVLGNAD